MTLDAAVILSKALYEYSEDYYCLSMQKNLEALIDLLSEDECEDVSGNDWEFKCSACGARIDVTDQNGESTMWDANGDATWPSHCPSCGARVKSKGASEIAHLSDAEQENRRSHEGGETTSVSFDTPKVTLVDGDSREKLEEDVRSYFALWVGGAPRTQEAVHGWIDRQAEITKCECINEASRYHTQLERERDELREELESADETIDRLEHELSMNADTITHLKRRVGNSVGLPVDADGESICVGDKVMHKSFVNPVEVVGVGKDSFFYRNGIGFNWFHHAHEVRHHHAPTVADVLEEFIAEYKRDDSELCDEEIIEMFAKRLQVKEDA